MKRFSLLRLQYNANQEIAEALTATKDLAIEILRSSCPVPLDSTGYAIVGDIQDFHHVSYVVAESFS